MIIELPCGYLKDGELYDHVKINEIRGKQQNYLVDADLTTDNFGHVSKILSELVTDYQTKKGFPLKDADPSEILWELPTEDIEVMLIKIREATYGPNYAMPTVCMHCGKQQFKSVKLDKLEIKKLPNKKKRTKTIKLPKSGVEAEIKLLYLKDLFDLHAALKDKKNTLFTATTVLSVARLGDNTAVTEADLGELPVTDVQLIEETYMKMRGSIDLMITSTCDECKQDYDNPLGVMDPLFFAQSQTPST
jgi:hypothetical protein